MVEKKARSDSFKKGKKFIPIKAKINQKTSKKIRPIP